MCLTVQDIHHQLPTELVPMKAKKDIVVYKLLAYREVKKSIPYQYKKLYFTPYMDKLVNFNIFGRCVVKVDRITGKYYMITSSFQKCSFGRKWVEQLKWTQNIEWIDGKNVSNVIRPNDIGICDKETLLISEGIHAYTKKWRQSKGTSGHCELHKAIIPKGSYYFVNEVNDEIVADKMIILKKVVK